MDPLAPHGSPFRAARIVLPKKDPLARAGLLLLCRPLVEDLVPLLPVAIPMTAYVVFPFSVVVAHIVLLAWVRKLVLRVLLVRAAAAS